MNGKAVVAVVVAAGVLSGVALAQSDGKRGRRGSGASGMVEYLGLTPEQRGQFQAMREEHRKEAEPLRAEGRELHDRLRAALEADKADATAVGQAALAVKEHRDKMKASSEAFRARMRAQLTPEQAQKFDAFEAARRFGRVDRSRGRGPGGPRPLPKDGPDGGLARGLDDEELSPLPIQG